jgi:hypothetical protein
VNEGEGAENESSASDCHLSTSRMRTGRHILYTYDGRSIGGAPTLQDIFTVHPKHAGFRRMFVDVAVLLAIARLLSLLLGILEYHEGRDKQQELTENTRGAVYMMKYQICPVTGVKMLAT